MAKTETPSDAVYFLSLSLENVRCFGSRQTLDLSDGNGRPARWTVILGDNGTGKTTLLQVLAGMTFTKVEVSNSKNDLRQLRLIELRHSLYRLNDDDLVIEAHFATGAALDKKQGAIKTIALNYTDNQYYSSTKGWNNDADKIKLNSLSCHAYGANRNLSKGVLSQEPSKDPAASLFNEKIELINAEEWLLQSDYIASKESEIQAQAQKRLDLIKDVLISLLPDVKDIRIRLPDKNTPKPIVVFKTLYCPPNGWLTLKALSLGYQTMTAWMVDLAAHLFQRYPDSPNPIAEPAVVLIDEIDLHLHPKWQRTIMSYLSERFVNTQFIVTAHSPLIVQAAENANIAVLKREGDEVHIHQQDQAVRGWRIDQLLTSDLFDLKSARSPHYEDLLEQRRKILSKPKLTRADQAKLKKLEEEIGDLPTAETPEDIQAMDIIRRAAEVLKSNP
jgi:predicted ATP-binding protein involved in virulence